MKEKKEKRLTEYSEDEKKSFVKFLISIGGSIVFNAVLIPFMFHINTSNYFYMGTLLSITSLAVIAETYRNHREEIKNYIYGKKYANKYFKDMEDKFLTLEDYIAKAKDSHDLYFNLKHNTATPLPAKFLQELGLEAYENALKAEMVVNIYMKNLKGNEKYYHEMLLSKDISALNVSTWPKSFDVSQDKANYLVSKYKELEEQLSKNCDVRQLNLKNFYVTKQLEKEPRMEAKDKVNDNNNKNNNKPTYKSKDNEFEQ